MALSFKFEELARIAASKRASDIFVKAGAPPRMKLHGDIIEMEGYPVLGDEEADELIYQNLSPEQIGRFERTHELDASLRFPGVCRFRLNVYRQRNSSAAVFRVIPEEIMTLDELNMPATLKEFAKLKDGLILVTGPTGCGKSTTLAAIINEINETRRANIITIEDPVEFVHPDKKALISQREVGIDTESFASALKYILRQAPDIILVGELRDVETMNIALSASETGHLVLSTLHTSSAAETLERIINMFPPAERELLCLRISKTLKGIVAQRLLKRIDKPGRIAAVEVMTATPTTVKLLEEGRSGSIYDAIKEGSYFGMQTMNYSLDRYVKAGVVSKQDAIANSGNISELNMMLRRTSVTREEMGLEENKKPAQPAKPQLRPRTPGRN
ncbi:MAG: PilT/PilU family type 4a pilus ATPase [Abditibacteriota bacterium]|nr:PilT/PilU family type 4a pilus ATPase [Abditibacteriota bacterium]